MHQATIKKAIQTPPFFIGRITDVELRMSYDLYHGSLMNIVSCKQELENNAGIHVKNNASLHIYVQRFIQAYDHCTHIAEWDKRGIMYQSVGKCQEWITQRTPRTPKIDAMNLEPYYFEDSWMPALKGKRILIIHPFAASFEKQVTKLHELFPNRSWFEDCTCTFIKPPMTMAGNHQDKDWQEHVEAFLPQLDSIEFDVALVAAGGYGMLISDYVFTTRHRSVMYIGGALQIFFGVIGKRWFTNPKVMALVNDNWIRPAQDERPLHYAKVEKGCYW